MLDSRTIIVLTAFSAAMMGVGMLAVARTYPAHIRGIKWWAWGGCGQAIGLALLGARGPIPEILSIIAGNTLVTLAQAVHYHALRDFTGKPRRLLLPGSIVGATCLGLIYFTVHTPDLRARAGVIALSAASLTFLCSQVVIGDPRRLHPVSYWLTGLGYLGCSTS